MFSTNLSVNDSISNTVRTTKINNLTIAEESRVSNVVVITNFISRSTNEFVELVNFTSFSDSSEGILGSSKLDNLLVGGDFPSNGLEDQFQTTEEDLVFISKENKGVLTNFEVNNLLTEEVSINNRGGETSSVIGVVTKVFTDTQLTLRVRTEGV